jgi:rhomboid protease GluP
MSETITTASRADDTVAPVDTFCTYLAKQFILKKGFVAGTVQEAEKLVAASDMVLTRHSAGIPLTILCLIDREAHPGKRFDLAMPELKSIVEACQRYSDQIGVGSPERMPVIIRVIEIGPTSPEQPARLKAIRLPMESTCLISALVVDTVAGTVWSSSLQGQPEWGFIEEVLRQLSEPEAIPTIAVELPPKSTPYLTFGLIGLLALIFVAELRFGITPPTTGFEPSIKTLVALGGLQYLLTIGQGQWYRIFSGPLLHANLIHILFNGAALLLAGYVLERAAGRLWFAAFFVVGALGGACGSLLANPYNLVSVGASGAIMGLFTALFVISFRYTNRQDRANLQRRAIQILIPSLLPLASAAKVKVDYGAHVGGAIAGAIAAYVLLNFWQERDSRPGFRWVAISIVALGFTGALTAGIAIPLKYHSWTATSQLIPPEQLPKKDSDIQETTAKRLLEKYPNDPRSHFYEAVVLIRNHDLSNAEHELRAALAEEFVMKEVLAPSFNLYVQSALALVLSDEHRLDDAKQSAAAGCQDRSSPPFGKLQATGLCAGPPQ